MKTQIMKTKSSPSMIVALLAVSSVLALAAPALGQKATVVKLQPLQTSISIHLSADDSPIMVVGDSNNPWYCTSPKYKNSFGMEASRVLVEEDFRDLKANPQSNTLLKSMADNFIKIQNKGTLDFWKSSAIEVPLFFDVEPENVILNPAQGQKISKSIYHCYTMAELTAGQREAIRWAKYMKDTWLPAHKVGK